MGNAKDENITGMNQVPHPVKFEQVKVEGENEHRTQKKQVEPYLFPENKKQNPRYR